MDAMPSAVLSAALSTLVPALAPATLRPASQRPSAPRARPEPETLHPALWRGHQLGRSADQALPSGFAALDAQLPGGGGSNGSWERAAGTGSI